MYCMIETAFANKDEARMVVDELLDKKLVASCQIVESDSKWNWNNELECSKEYLVFMKTKRELSKEIFETIKRLHSYDCFEFAIFELTSCNEDYCKWIEDVAR